MPGAIRADLEKWRAAVQAGHEIGNHTLTHPCHRTTRWTLRKPLEKFTLEEIEKDEILRANSRLCDMLGVLPESFAYPCGHTEIGPDGARRSYIPLVERHFLAGRGYRGECAENPATCDLSHVKAVPVDDCGVDRLMKLIQESGEAGGWLILAGHHAGARGPGTVDAALLEILCNMAKERESGIWMDSIANVSRYIRQQRCLTQLKPLTT